MISFPIAKIPSAKQKWLACAGLALGTSLVLWLVMGVLAKQPGEALWLSAGIAVLVVAAFVLFDRSKHVRFEVEDRELRIRGDIFFWQAISIGGSEAGKCCRSGPD